ncbi:beta-glucoside-specific PTS transporter subunit IIABC [Vagococcus bubulae]|uniref:PTS system sucrose-specific EIIBCA component n=1 Tax=Vagococcus bubulae TaxID=1977868 RepID=A0A429ZMZ1_9ENTE|nr:beta-glucoside-specific PTS transporter subunit IIABC [Vagococcus bubulae]RST95067.1 PTS beta-glucoside transporter subunit EIIBCA [Vagococcus bubulae]
MNNRELAENIVREMGGKENITQNWHCITRLRFNVADSKKINIEAIKQLDGVMGAQFQSGQFQVIIGSEVANVFQEVDQITHGSISEEAAQPSSSGNVLDKIFDVISGIFTPILAAITGSGLLKGIMAILVWANMLNAEGSTYMILDAISNATFHFLPFLVAFSAANKFKTNPSLAGALAGILMYPQIMTLADAGEVSSVTFLGFLNIPMNNYASSVLPIILGVWLMSYVEKYAKKIVPKSLTIIFVPLLTLLITAPLVLAFIAPLGTFIGTYLEMFFTKLFGIAGPVAGALMGGLMPLIVVTGMHYAFFPGTFASLGKLGYDIMLLPLNLVANLAQAGATLGVLIKTKDTKMKQIAVSAFIPALFGITEPAIYGVTMKLKKPFYASMVGGAVGGAIYGTFVVKTFSFAVPGLLALPTYIEKGTNNFLWAVIGVLASFVVGLIVTLVMPFDTGEEFAVENKESTTTEDQSSIVENKSHKVIAPLTGEIKELATCPDETFASGIVGKGLGVIPAGDFVYAPFDGTVTMTTPTKHAIGLVSNDGVELLIHVGLDTVELNGKGFEYFVKEGDVVARGDKLLSFNRQEITEAGLSLYTPVIVTNTPNFLDVVQAVGEGENVTAGEEEVLIVVS